MSAARMDPADLEALADLIASRLASGPEGVTTGKAPAGCARCPQAAQDGPGALFLTAAEVARRFGVTAGWVRENADRLGALRLGDGPKPRLRFDVDKVTAAMTSLCANERSAAREPVPPKGGIPSKNDNSIGLAGVLPFFEASSESPTSRTAPQRANARGQAERNEASPRAERSPSPGRATRAAGRTSSHDSQEVA